LDFLPKLRYIPIPMSDNNKDLDLSVYFVADPDECGGKSVTDVVKNAVRGGVSMVQYRDKSGDKNRIRSTAREIKQWLDTYQSQSGGRHIPFLINDHVDIAQEIDADGAHIGQDDMKAAAARDMLGKDKILGMTAFTPEHFHMMNATLVDYAGTGPFYPTKTDKGKPVLGREKFTALVKLSPVPVVGIGGITPLNAKAVFQAGAQGVAMMRSISLAQNPRDIAAQFLHAFKDAQDDTT
jgi:thiamine-phosphate pyrophosphorylase